MGRKLLTDPQDTEVTRVTMPSEKASVSEACLVVIVGDEIGRKIQLGQGTLIAGRSAQADLQLDQESVSRNHACFVRTSHGYSVGDMGSTNGTLLNDVVVEEAMPLRDGDQVRIGRVTLKFITSNNVEAQYHEEIYAMMTTDGLTGCHNKRYFVDALEREAARCRRYGRTFSLVMFDIDHFKKVNDTYGHLAGDEVLRTLGAAVLSRIRTNDTVSRVGGEEFSVLLPESELEGAAAFAEKLRDMVEQTKFVFEGKHIPITISLGVSGWEKGFENGEDVVKAADAMLYDAKNGGRNRVCH